MRLVFGLRWVDNEEKQMRTMFIVLSLALMFGMIGVPPVAGQTPSAQKVAAQVSGKVITYQDLDDEFRSRSRVPFESVQDDPRAQEARKRLLQQMIAQELLFLEAERKKLTVAPAAVSGRFKDIRARFPSDEAFKQALASSGLTEVKLEKKIKRDLMIEEFVEKEVLEKIVVSPEEVKAFYQEHKDDYAQEEEVHARHILIKVAPGASPEDDGKAKDRAKAVLARAKKGEDFATLAKETSEGPSGARGGDLGYFGRGKMVKPFEEVAFKLKVGEVSDLVRSNFGYHIILVEDRKEAKRPSYDEVKDRVRDDLVREKAAAGTREYIEVLRKQAKITINVE
ncbi:MAG: peptidylprolyl isomerase [candidate division NC10 bacterium]|nr:peptidylprolyl isomerase [candidate division NC10 bacterium]